MPHCAMSLAAAVGLTVLCSCGTPPGWDTQPPRLLDAAVTADREALTLSFDEPVAVAETGGDFPGAGAPASVAGPQVTVPLSPKLKPGKPYAWTAEVKDRRENLTSLTGRFYGPNPHPAGLRLNEIRVAGSGPHPDLVELRVEAPGSLAGWTLEVWSSPTNPQRKILPDVVVEPGALVVIHGKLTGAPGECDETTDCSEAQGPETEPTAWDFWIAEGKGLPGTKGAVVLKPTPEALPTDGWAYGTKDGEGIALAQAAQWQTEVQGDPTGCTATRTWCRTDDREPKWMVVANGAATPGKPNRLILWEGPTSTRKGTPKTKGRTKDPRRAVPGSETLSAHGSRSTAEEAEAN